MLHNFQLGNRKLRLWQRQGESYAHVLMKALGYSMFVGRFPHLSIERNLGLRYTPDIVATGASGEIEMWGECGLNSLRKTAWLAKHSGAAAVFLFKIDHGAEQLTSQLRAVIAPRYRAAGRLRLINFIPEIFDLTASRQIAKVSADWYTETIV